MTLYEIIKSLQEAQGSNAKQAILMQHKDNALLKEYMRVTYDPAINFWQKKLQHSDLKTWSGTQEFDSIDIHFMLNEIAGRKVTGLAAEASLNGHVSALNDEGRTLIQLMMNRSIGAGVGDTMVLKTWPNLYFSVPYQRCSLLDKKAKEKFSKLNSYLIQEKFDGAFAYVAKGVDAEPQVITRAGSIYPKEFSAQIAKGLPNDIVLAGEIVVFTNPIYNGEMQLLDRKTGNGILNSILKGGEVNSNYIYRMYAWDILSMEEFKSGKSVRKYSQRLAALDVLSKSSVVESIQSVETFEVHSMEEAFKIYSEFTAQGKEGAVLKTTDFLWKDGTSKDCVKMKVEFEIDLKITGVVEGSGKAAGMCGALQLTSSCGKLVTDVGTGMTDDMRKVFWMHKHDMIGKIVTIKANDIISKRGSDTFSCFLPVFVEERLDKTEANSYDECVAILSAAKGITTG
jgi:DNA ligase-1